jgi:hypothetical protein
MQRSTDGGVERAQNDYCLRPVCIARASTSDASVAATPRLSLYDARRFREAQTGSSL